LNRGFVTVPYAFLVLKEHPYGREMLRQLLAAGLEPAILIEEDSAVAEEERRKFYGRLAGQPRPPTFDELLAGRTVRRATTPHHNQEECARLLQEMKPDLIVLGGTRIIRPQIFNLARHGALNSHPGLLPQVRGSASVAWSIYYDVPIGCTCHFIDESVDTGDIVGQRTIAVRRGDTYERLVHETVVLAGALMVEALQQFEAGTLQRTPQPKVGHAYGVMPPEMVGQVKARLAEGTYGHFEV
jgi:methionyl-tRNA formyltransferase